MAVNTFKDAAAAVQKIFENGSDNEKERAVELAAQMGSQAWMACGDEGELSPILEELKGTTRLAFLEALDEVVSAPNNRDSMIAENLRPYVKKALKEARAAL